jgi:anti-sigma-K factor RskA
MKQHISHYLTGWPVLIGAVALVAVVVLALFTGPALQRAGSPGSTASPSGGKVVKYEIREDSGSTPVNAIQIKGLYVKEQLEFKGVDEAGSSFPISTESKGDGGSISLARGTTTSVTGDHLVAKVVFKPLTSQPAEPVMTDGTILVATANTANIYGQSGVRVYFKEVK